MKDVRKERRENKAAGTWMSLSLVDLISHPTNCSWDCEQFITFRRTDYTMKARFPITIFLALVFLLFLFSKLGLIEKNDPLLCLTRKPVPLSLDAQILDDRTHANQDTYENNGLISNGSLKQNSSSLNYQKPWWATRASCCHWTPNQWNVSRSGSIWPTRGRSRPELRSDRPLCGTRTSAAETRSSWRGTQLQTHNSISQLQFAQSFHHKKHFQWLN